jgi:hypothetical protein
MILRRLVTALSKQSWLTLVLELVVVVVGIFLGLQVDSWNDARKDRVLEQQYLASLKADFQADIEELDEAIALAKSRAQLGRLLISSIDTDRVEGDPNEFIWAVYSSFLLNYPSYTRATINDLLSTGNLQLLQDANLKAAVAEYYTDIEYREQWKINWREAQIAMEQTLPHLLDFDVREAGLLRYSGGPDWITKEFQFDSSVAEQILRRIIEHPQAKGQIENMTRIQDTMYLILTANKEHAMSLVESLSQ